MKSLMFLAVVGAAAALPAPEGGLPRMFHSTGNRFVYRVAGSSDEEAPLFKTVGANYFPYNFGAPLFKSAGDDSFIPAFTYSSPFVKTSDDDKSLLNYMSIVSPSVEPFGFEPLFEGYEGSSAEVAEVKSADSSAEVAEVKSADSSSEAEGTVVVEPQFAAIPSLYTVAPSAFSAFPYHASGISYTHGFPFLPHQYVLAKAESSESD